MDARLYSDAGTHRARYERLIVNRDGHIQWVNAAFSSLTGYPFEEVVGRNPRHAVRTQRRDTRPVGRR